MSLRALSHAVDDARPSTIAKGADHDCPACGRTCTDEQVKQLRGAVNATRRHYADLAAEELADAFGATKASWQQWADRMGVARQVARRFGETDGARVALGDVLMAPQPVAIALLKSLVKRLQGHEAQTASAPMPTRERATRAVEGLGELLRIERAAMEDGRLDASERQAIEKSWEEIEAIAQAGRADLRRTAK